MALVGYRPSYRCSSWNISTITYVNSIIHYIYNIYIYILYTPGTGRITVVSQTNQFSHWFPDSLVDPLQLVRFIHWFPRLLGFTTGTSASTKALTRSNFSAGSSWEIRRSWKFKWQQLELHHLGFSWTLGSFDGLSGRYMEPSWTNRGDQSCLHSHTKNLLLILLRFKHYWQVGRCWKVPPSMDTKMGAFQNWRTPQTWLLDVGKIVLHDWVYQWICGIPHSWTNPYLVFTGGARVFEVWIPSCLEVDA